MGDRTARVLGWTAGGTGPTRYDVESRGKTLGKGEGGRRGPPYMGEYRVRSEGGEVRAAGVGGNRAQK